MTVLYLLRHAEQVIRSGSTPAAGLSARGHEQAQLVGERLRNLAVAGIHHSPLPRAASTAQVVAGYLPGVAVHEAALLTDLTPVPSPASEAAYPPQDLPWLADVPAAERDEDGVRIAAAIRHFSRLAVTQGTEDGEPGRHLLITHGFVISWFVRDALDAPAWRWLGLNPLNASLTTIQYLPGHAPALIGYNDVGHLPEHLRT